VTVSDGASGTCTIASLSAGVGSCSISEPVGTFTVTATYGGDVNNTAATGSATEKVK
jgi:hypothetical protein